MKKTTKIIGIVTLVLIALSLFFTIGADTSFGKVVVKHLVIPTADGDEINCLMYRPKSATAENPAPAVMLAHGGNDMAEQMTSYCIELSRRGYVVITRDATGAHNSDPASPDSSEQKRVEAAGYRPQGLRAILKTLQGFNFVDQEHIVGMGHSLGGTNSMSLAVDTGAVFLSINLGQNMYGKGTFGCYDYNYDVIVGDADEAVMMNCTPQGDTYNSLQTEVLKRVFLGDYETPAEQLPNLEFNKRYSVIGSDGNTYYRTAYQPASTHAYYLCTQDAVQTVVYAICSEVGVGLDSSIRSYEDHVNIKTIWQLHDIGYFCTFLAILGTMFFVASALLQTPMFGKLILKKREGKSLSYKKFSWQWIVCAVILFVSPLLLFKYGILGSTKFFGFINVSKLWLLGGNNNVIIAWQWYSALLMLALFLVYHFTYGKKIGGNMITYGFVTSDDDKFDFKYILRALGFGLAVVGSAYLVFALISAYTKQGIHITTFMLSKIHIRRTPAFFMYFLFQIPYFIVSSLAFKSIGITEGGDDTKSILKTIGLCLLFTIGLLFIYWLWWICYLQSHNTVPYWFFDRNNLKGFLFIASNKIVVYNMLILPMCIGMAVANALNIYVVKKTRSIWTGLFTALLWGTWMLVSCGDLAKVFY